MKLSPNMKLYKGREFAINYKRQALSELAPEQHIPDYPELVTDVASIPLKGLQNNPIDELSTDYGWFNETFVRVKMRQWIEKHGDIEINKDQHRRYLLHTVRHEHPRKGWLIKNPAMFAYHPLNLERGQLWISEARGVHKKFARNLLYDTGFWLYPLLLTKVEDIPMREAEKMYGTDHTKMPELCHHPATIGYEYAYRIVKIGKNETQVFTGSLDKEIRVFTGNRIRALRFDKCDPMMPVIFYTPEQANHFYQQWLNRGVRAGRRHAQHYLRKYRIVLGKPSEIKDKSLFDLNSWRLANELSRKDAVEDKFNYALWNYYQLKIRHTIPSYEECQKYIDSLE